MQTEFPKQLIKSAYLKITDEDRDGVTLIHSLSGRQFKVCKKTVTVLDFFREPQFIEQLSLSSAMKLSIHELWSKGLLVDYLHREIEAVLRIPNKPSYFGLPNLDGQQSPQVVMIGVPFAGGNTEFPEVKGFPSRLRQLSDMYGIDLSGKSWVNMSALGENLSVQNLAALVKENLLKDGGDILCHPYESRRHILAKIKTLLGELFSAGYVPFSIGGDHSMSLPIIQAASTRYDEFQVFHFDAHTDVYSSAFEPMLQVDNIHHHGNFVSHCLKIPQITQYYQFGIRGINNITHQDKPKLKTFWVNELKRAILQQQVLDIPLDVPCYITFDIDVMDPSLAPGTNTPVPNGFTLTEILDLFKLLQLNQRRIIGLDFVEVNVKKDTGGLTGSLATQLILNLLNQINPQLIPTANKADKQAKYSFSSKD
jgi:agmatinase